jgi:hypothetical protein
LESANAVDPSTDFDLSVEGFTAVPFFPIHFPVITRAPIGKNGKLELKTINNLFNKNGDRLG